MKGIMDADVYYSSVGIGRDGGKEKENKFESYLNVPQQWTGNINFWYVSIWWNIMKVLLFEWYLYILT